MVNQTYTEADVRELRKEWERDQQQRDITTSIAELKGQLAALPAQMEAVARRVVVEVLAEQRTRAAERTWAHAPTVMQVLQLLFAVGLAVAGYFAGKGEIP